MSKPVHLDESNFGAFVTQKDKPVLIDFWATWCGPCKNMAPEFEEAAENEGDIFHFGKVDIDACPNITRQCRISCVPTIAVFEQGGIVTMIEGYRKAIAITGEAKSYLRGFYEEKGCCANCGECGKDSCDGDCDCDCSHCSKRSFCPRAH